MNSTTTCTNYIEDINDGYPYSIFISGGPGGDGKTYGYDSRDGSVFPLTGPTMPSYQECVTVSSGSSSVQSGYNGPNLSETLFMYIPILVIMMIPFWRWIISPIKEL